MARQRSYAEVRRRQNVRSRPLRPHGAIFYGCRRGPNCCGDKITSEPGHPSALSADIARARRHAGECSAPPPAFSRPRTAIRRARSMESRMSASVLDRCSHLAGADKRKKFISHHRDAAIQIVLTTRNSRANCANQRALRRSARWTPWSCLDRRNRDPGTRFVRDHLPLQGNGNGAFPRYMQECTSTLFGLKV